MVADLATKSRGHVWNDVLLSVVNLFDNQRDGSRDGMKEEVRQKR